LIRLNTSLQKFDSVFIVPAMQVFWILFSVITGGIYFQEFQSFAWYQYAPFALGLLLLVIGVLLLAPRTASTNTATSPYGIVKPHDDGSYIDEQQLDEQIDREFQMALHDNYGLPPVPLPTIVALHASQQLHAEQQGTSVFYPMASYLPHPLIQLELQQQQLVEQHQAPTTKQPVPSPYAIFARPIPVNDEIASRPPPMPPRVSPPTRPLPQTPATAIYYDV
jgi:hypothetical protein